MPADTKKGTEKRRYRPTESQYKGKADEMYVTYDREQRTSNGKNVSYPKIRRVYIAGNVKDWKLGTFKNKAGREVYGLLIEYEQSRKGYQRKVHAGKQVKTTDVKPAVQIIRKIVEIPEQAQNVRFHKNAKRLPKKYQSALQNVR